MIVIICLNKSITCLIDNMFFGIDMVAVNYNDINYHYGADGNCKLVGVNKAKLGNQNIALCDFQYCENTITLYSHNILSIQSTDMIDLLDLP